MEVLYQVYGHALVTEGFDVTPEHLFLNAALGLPYVDGHQEDPYEVVLHVPSEWRVYTELARVAESPTRLRARNYDELVDSPIDCGQPVELGFHADGVPHSIVLCGTGGNYEPHRLEEDLRKIVEAAHRIIGEPPSPHYTFFYHLTDVRDGGLEHTSSNSCVIPRNMFQPASSYRGFLALTSHEYFHAYNVKRIRPAALGPFDYTREMYTKLLWWMEGTTDYYGWIVLRRAGLLTPARSLEELAKLGTKLLQIPGRRVQSIEESSWLAWIDYYRPQENTPNRSVSYYDKGFLVSWALDLEIRTRTENRASLDDVVRALWKEYGRPGVGVPEDALVPFDPDRDGRGRLGVLHQVRRGNGRARPRGGRPTRGPRVRPETTTARARRRSSPGLARGHVRRRRRSGQAHDGPGWRAGPSGRALPGRRDHRGRRGPCHLC